MNMNLMATSECISQFVVILSVAAVLLPVMASSVGINYGQIGDNLPSPEEVVPLIKSIGVTKVKLYDANPAILKAFADSDVEFMVCIPNVLLSKLQDPYQARDWVKRNVQPHLPATKITAIVVGNEVFTLNDTDTDLTLSLLPAMQSLHAALISLRLDAQVSVTTTHSLSVLQTSYPPSAGRFLPHLSDCFTEILSFHARTGSPFLINAYPFFAYKANPKQIPLDFVLFQPNQGNIDPNSGLRYDNMLFAQIDAVYTALASLGFKKVPVHISETGWPSKGDADEYGATPDNARRYNGNLIKLMDQNKGTPMRPGSDLNIFIFALFNENMKPGPTSERNYGLFKADGTPAYSLGFSGVQALANSTTSGGDDEQGQQPPPLPPPVIPSATGYLSISDATDSAQREAIRIIIWTGLIVFLA